MSQNAFSFQGKVALLTAGPSLHDFWSDAKYTEYDSVIAVNFAGYVYQHDWFAFWEEWILDPVMFSSTLEREVSRRLPLKGYIINKDFDTDMPCIRVPMLPGSSGYTMPNVLRHLLNISDAHTHFDIYGMDLQGGVDCLGNGGENRDPERWKKELKYLMPYLQDTRVEMHGGIADVLNQYLEKARQEQVR